MFRLAGLQDGKDMKLTNYQIRQFADYISGYINSTLSKGYIDCVDNTGDEYYIVDGIGINFTATIGSDNNACWHSEVGSYEYINCNYISDLDLEIFTENGVALILSPADYSELERLIYKNITI